MIYPIRLLTIMNQAVSFKYHKMFKQHPIGGGPLNRRWGNSPADGVYKANIKQIIFSDLEIIFQLYRVNLKCLLNKSGRFLEIPGENRLKVWIGFEFGVVVDLASRQAIRANASGSLQI